VTAVRFLHTADLQLGMRRHYLDTDAQARFGEARLGAVRTIARLVPELAAEFVVVAGDVFESNQVDRRTVWRACDALAEVPVPVFLLPGNHDPLRAGSVWDSIAFRQRVPEHVIVLRDATPVEVRPGVEVVGAPWRAKRHLTDLAADAVEGLVPAAGVTRVLVAHGAMDDRHADRGSDPSRIGVARLDAALEDGRIHVACLGDRHSVTAVGTSGRAWYAGAPEPTDVVEERPGHVLLHEVAADGSHAVTERPVATWRFHQLAVDLLGDEDVDALVESLDRIADKDRAVVVLRWSGSVSVRGRARIDQLLEDAIEVFGAVDLREQHCDLTVVPDDADLTGLHGFAQWTVDALRERVHGEDCQEAADALALLHRLQAGAA